VASKTHFYSELRCSHRSWTHWTVFSWPNQFVYCCENFVLLY